ncbi:MAG: alanine racemase, partial [Oscillospiraceae bacterium]|nr:alanine racemase [Oscillospiraceae bacterium]
MQFDMNIMNNSYVETDMNIYRQNMNIILSSLPEGCTLIPVLKCNAYGLGMTELAKPAAELARVSYIAVSHVAEGLELRAAGIEKDILVMSSALPSQLAAAVLAHLTLAARSADFVRALDAAAGSLGMAAKVHIKIDTGLHRIGAEPGAELDELISALRSCKHVEATGVFSHFADT